MLEKWITRFREFLARETVLAIAAAAALTSCVAVPPDEGYASYVDWRTLALLFCLMAVVGGFKSLGVLDRAATLLLGRVRSQRGVAGVLIGLSFFASMLVTNDVALITFVPLSLAVARRAGMEGRLCLLATLMTIAANMGSMLTPVGNPQNLYLFSASQMSVGEFLLISAPYVIASGAMLALACACGFPGGASSKKAIAARVDAVGVARNAERRVEAGASSVCGCSQGADSEGGEGGEDREGVDPSRNRSSRCKLALFAALFVACLACVAGPFDVRMLLALVLACAVVSDRGLLRRVDWGLLATFVVLFVFVGNMGRVPMLRDALSAAVGGNALLAAVGFSQIISNVPTAVLMSGFTDQWGALIVGADIGGLGTPIASMASLITLKMVTVGRAGLRRGYLITFSVWNAVFLAALLVMAALL